MFFQNDDYGKDYLKGLKIGLAAKRTLIVSELGYEITDTSYASQIARQKASGADTWVLLTTPTPTVRAIATAKALAWKPDQIVINSVSNTDSVMQAAARSAGADFVNGSVSSSYTKNPTNPKYANDAAVKRYRSIMARFSGGADANNTFHYYGVAKASDVIRLLYLAGKNPTRASLMAATAKMNWVNPFLLAGIKVKTGPQDRFPISQMKLIRYNERHLVGVRPADQGSLDHIDKRGPASPAPVSLMDFTLTPEQELVRETARAFCDREVTPHAREWDRDEELDRELVGKLAEVGFLAGWELDTLSYCLVMEELGVADSSVRGIVSVTVGLVGKTIKQWGTDAQVEEWIPKLGSGEGLGCYALTEPGSGSDPASLTTRAERDGDDWLISGSKIFITLGTWASVALVFARTGGEGARGLTCFLVPTDSEGFEARPIKGKLGLRAQDTGELFLERVRVPDSARLGAEGEGFKVAMSALDNGRISLAAGCVGIARGCLDASVAYAKDRTQFGQPIARFQLVQELIADIGVELEAARFLTWRAAALADAGERHTLESSVAKYYASEASVRAANAAVQVHGGYGYVDEYPVGKYLRDARVTTLYEGTSQVQKLIIGRALTGESAFA